MTMGCPGRMQAKHHLVPPLILSEVLWEACHIALGQPFEFLQQLLPLVHRVKTLDPKHNICTSKGNTLPNGLFFGSTNPLQFMMTAPSVKVTSPLRSALLMPILDQSPPRARPLVHRQKSVPVEVPPRMSFRHVMPTSYLSTNQVLRRIL